MSTVNGSTVLTALHYTLVNSDIKPNAKAITLDIIPGPEIYFVNCIG